MLFRSCVVAVGTETNGSIISPASVCGVVGVKPTVGLVSRSVIIPIAASYDTAGPMARTVRDAAILLDVLAGPDQTDAVTLKAPARVPNSHVAALQQRARAMGLNSIVVLTTRTMHWFLKRGFIQVDPEWLPDGRKRKYNWDRRSQVLVKHLK